MYNTPYVRKIDSETGKTLFPPEGYFNFFPNRAQRRKKEKRAFNNRKTCSISMVGAKFTYFRRKQTIVCYDKDLKKVIRKEIIHYDLKGM